MSWPIFFAVVALAVVAMFYIDQDQENRQKCRDRGGEVVKTYRSWTCVGDGEKEE